MRFIARSCLVAIVAAGFGAAALAAGDPAAGAAVYKANRCQICHSVVGQGGKMGGPLDGVGLKHDADWLRRSIKDPKSVNPKAKMKAFPALSDKDLDDLVAYMVSIKPETGKK